MMQKLSTRLPGLERRMEVLKEIASEHNIVLQFDGPSTSTEVCKFKKREIAIKIVP
jgi:hypothetical protein